MSGESGFVGSCVIRLPEVGLLEIRKPQFMRHSLTRGKVYPRSYQDPYKSPPIPLGTPPLLRNPHQESDSARGSPIIVALSGVDVAASKRVIGCSHELEESAESLVICLTLTS